MVAKASNFTVMASTDTVPLDDASEKTGGRRTQSAARQGRNTERAMNVFILGIGRFGPFFGEILLKLNNITQKVHL